MLAHGYTIKPGHADLMPYVYEAAEALIAAELRDCGSGDVVANARLIAAAPELLAVLKELQESAVYWSEYDVPLGIVDRINAVIDKATGGQS